jgi:peroxiredoxin
MKRLLMLFAVTLMIVPSASIAKMMAEISEGARVPAGFSARDSGGKVRSFASISGRNGAVLVFFRSAKWCPFCQAQLKDLRGAQAVLAQRGYSLNAISYDAPATLAGFAKAQGVGYTLLSDAGSRMIDTFGLRDPQYPPGSFADGVPKPTVLVISAGGKILRKMVSDDYRIRPTNADIVAAVPIAK